MAGYVTIQELLDALAEHAATTDGVRAAYSSEQQQINKPPTVIVSWFSDIDTEIRHGSDELWVIAAKATLYGDEIKGNNPYPSIKSYSDIIHPLVTKLSLHPSKYQFGTKMYDLATQGHIDRVAVTRVRPAEFGLIYGGHNYYGAELFLDIKLHRRNV